MLEWFGDEAVRIRVAFSKVFGPRWRPFGSAALRLGGLSDGAEGVQWNVAYDPRDGRRWVGVNLEGTQPDDWPVVRLLERERRDPELLDLVQDDRALHPVVLVWRRDYWQATSRPFIQERNIAPTPIALGDLTEDRLAPRPRGGLCLPRWPSQAPRPRRADRDAGERRSGAGRRLAAPDVPAFRPGGRGVGAAVPRGEGADAATVRLGPAAGGAGGPGKLQPTWSGLRRGRDRSLAIRRPSP